MLTRILLITTTAASAASAGTVVHPDFEAAPPDSAWSFSSAFYAPLMGLEGNVGAGPLSADVDMSFGDIFSNLDAGLSGAFEAQHENWSLSADFTWLKLSESIDPTAASDLEFSQNQLMGSLTLGYEVFGNDRTRVDALIGGAFNHIDVDLDLYTPNLAVKKRGVSRSQQWIDPYFGVRARHELSDRWSLWARADYGGFDVSSEQYWQGIAGVAWRVNGQCSLALAYRVISIDYQHDGLTYDADSSGPNLGLIVRF